MTLNDGTFTFLYAFVLTFGKYGWVWTFTLLHTFIRASWVFVFTSGGTSASTGGKFLPLLTLESGTGDMTIVFATVVDTRCALTVWTLCPFARLFTCL